jgi:DNA polymerase/3'-5' exonuclease PolX
MAYQRAAAKIRTLSESIDELVGDNADLTAFTGIGEPISGAIREIVRTGTLGKLETLRAEASPELAGISQNPRLDPQTRASHLQKARHYVGGGAEGKARNR